MEGREVVELGQLGGDGVDDLGPAVADGDAPEPGEAVDDAVAAVVGDPPAVGLDDDAGPLLDHLPGPGDRVDEAPRVAGTEADGYVGHGPTPCRQGRPVAGRCWPVIALATIAEHAACVDPLWTSRR